MALCRYISVTPQGCLTASQMRLVHTLIGSGQQSNVSYMIPLEFPHRASVVCALLQTVRPAAGTQSPKEASDPCTGKPELRLFEHRADEQATNLWVITHKHTTQSKPASSSCFSMKQTPHVNDADVKPFLLISEAARHWWNTRLQRWKNSEDSQWICLPTKHRSAGWLCSSPHCKHSFTELMDNNSLHYTPP